MKNYKYNKKNSTTFAIKGTLSDDCKVIDYVNSDKEDATISLGVILAKFAGQEISLSISTAVDEDLSEGFEDEDEE